MLVLIRLEREKSPPRGDGSLSHSAARHKMAIRPRRNHASRPRRMQEVKEEEPAVTLDDHRSSPGILKDEEQKVLDMKNKSKSLDMQLRRGDQPPSSAMLKAMAVAEEKSPQSGKLETDAGFLSRLFGSKRSKARLASSNHVHQVEEAFYQPKPLGGGPLPSPSKPVSPGLLPHHDQSNRLQPVEQRPSPPRSKPFAKARAPPPPPSYSPPEYRRTGEYNKQQQRRKSISKSQSFRQLDGAYGDPEYPSLPAHVPNNDIILKKNKSMSSVLENSEVASRMKFRSSVENWSFANEGLKQSIFSLADSKPIPATSHSNESLKTITSLLEEPDVLVQTRVVERSSGGSYNMDALSGNMSIKKCPPPPPRF